MTASAAREELAAALRSLDLPVSWRVYTDMTASIDPPALMVGAPTLFWRGLDRGPAEMSVPLYVIGELDVRGLDLVWDVLPPLVAGIESAGWATTGEAAPTAWTGGGRELPAYEISVRMDL